MRLELKGWGRSYYGCFLYLDDIWVGSLDREGLSGPYTLVLRKDFETLTVYNYKQILDALYEKHIEVEYKEEDKDE